MLPVSHTQIVSRYHREYIAYHRFPVSVPGSWSEIHNKNVECRRGEWLTISWSDKALQLDPRLFPSPGGASNVGEALRKLFLRAPSRSVSE